MPVDDVISCMAQISGVHALAEIVHVILFKSRHSKHKALFLCYKYKAFYNYYCYCCCGSWSPTFTLPLCRMLQYSGSV